MGSGDNESELLMLGTKVRACQLGVYIGNRNRQKYYGPVKINLVNVGLVRYH